MPAPRNELTLLDNAIAEQQGARPGPLPADRAFALFAAEQILKSRELSADEVEAGIVDGGNDGGIDAVYSFLGDSVLDEDSDVRDEGIPATSFERGLLVSLLIIQAKQTESFGETTIDLLSSSLERLLDLQENESDLLELYSPAVVLKLRLFTQAWQKLATRRPQLQLTVVYASRGATEAANPKVATKAADLREKLEKLVPGSKVMVELRGAEELWALYSKSPSYSLELPFQEMATSGTSHAAIVLLRDYFGFITEDGTIRRHIFDWNVRDYQGDIEVNQEIRRSLDSADAPEFWWMNNGVTIVCSQAQIVGKTFALEDVQIVNGLQTSHVIFEALKDAHEQHPAWTRRIFCRILVTQEPSVRDQVVRATNRQTSVPAASLRATDDVQRNIESYFSSRDWYYDRRKNYYRNLGKPSERIVSIPLLAQAIMAMGLGQPDSSRARPSSLLKRDEDYNRIFSPDLPVQTYLWIAKQQRFVDATLASEAVHASSTERTNLRFYVAMLAVARLFGSRVYSPAQLSALASEDATLSNELVTVALGDVRAWADEFKKDEGWALDRKAKSGDLTTYIYQKAELS